MERDDKIPGERSSRIQAPQRGKSQVHSESSEEDTDAKGRGVPDVTGKRGFGDTKRDVGITLKALGSH